jgi:hypothetical protein
MATFSSKFRKTQKTIIQPKIIKPTVTTNPKTTVEGRHLTMIQEFDDEHSKLLPQKRKNLQTRQKQYEKLLSKKDKSGLEPIEYTLLNNLKREITQLEKEIKMIETKQKESTYLLDVSDILDEYDSITTDSKNDKSRTIDAPITEIKQRSDDENVSNNRQKPDIFSFMNPQTKKPIFAQSVFSDEKKSIKTKGKITSYIDIHDNSEKSRADVYDELMQLTDPNYVSEKLQKDRSMTCLCKTPDENNIIFNFTTGTQICEACGSELSHFYDSQFTSYKESQEHDVPIDFPYIRMNHFNELIAQFQAKEQTDIPEQVFQDLKTEFKKDRITNYNQLHYKLVKQKLQKLGHTNMYEHIPYIMHKFNGLPPPVLTLEDETQFRIMFKQIQEPFERCKHLAKSDRKNFLSYSYVFYKFAELLSLDHLLRCFRLLKSREKLFAQDKVWKAICAIKEWQFIPSL